MIVVTGGTGLVGSHVLYRLLQANERIRALRRTDSRMDHIRRIFSCYTDEPDKLLNRIEWVEGDLLDPGSMEELLQGATAIYHCAAMVSFDAHGRDEMLHNNVQGTANLINAAIVAKVEKFCHVSSISALGKNKDGTAINETSYWVPSLRKSAYSRSKFFSEMEVWRGIEEELDAVIVNPAVILGPGNWNAGSPKFFQTVWKGLNYYTKGKTGFVDVRDVAEAMVCLMEERHFPQTKNNRYILSAGNMSYQDLFNKIAGSLRRPGPRWFASDLLLQLGWRAARLVSFFTGKKPLITRETVAGANGINHYDGSKIIRSVSFQYRELDETIQDISGFFLKDHSGEASVLRK